MNSEKDNSDAIVLFSIKNIPEWNQKSKKIKKRNLFFLPFMIFKNGFILNRIFIDKLNFIWHKTEWYEKRWVVLYLTSNATNLILIHAVLNSSPTGCGHHDDKFTNKKWSSAQGFVHHFWFTEQKIHLKFKFVI